MGEIEVFPSNKEEGNEHGGRIPRRFLFITLVTIFLVVPFLIWKTKTGGNGKFNINQQTFYGMTTPTSPTWVSVQLDSNYIDTVVSQWSCLQSETANITIAGLDHHHHGNNGNLYGVAIQLPAGEIHEFVITSLDEHGRLRCLGGDYFEVDLSSDSWKSRPPVKDHGNGRYTLYLQVHPEFIGTYILNINLLFRSFEGFKHPIELFIFHKQMRSIAIKFYNPHAHADRDGGASLPPLLPLLPDVRVCTPEDFSKEVWNGRWTRHERNDSCEISPVDGRFRCLDLNISCHMPWCQGHVGALESNGWVYSAHCSFRIFTQADAWSCLKGKWLFFSGDSNHVDTTRNLLNFALGVWGVGTGRRFDEKYRNPNNSSEEVRITSIFNGHPNENMNHLGIETFRDVGFQDLMRRYFSEKTAPDVVIFNSGLHDGLHDSTLPQFIETAEYTADFWSSMFEELTLKDIKSPAMIYRKTVAVGGYARDMGYNPHKMEVYDAALVEKLKLKGLLTKGGVVDDFDMTFPWHYDLRCSDGIHYGVPPASGKWVDGGIGHQYFADLMLVHVLLNAICHT